MKPLKMVAKERVSATNVSIVNTLSLSTMVRILDYSGSNTLMVYPFEGWAMSIEFQASRPSSALNVSSLSSLKTPSSQNSSAIQNVSPAFS